MKLFYYRVAPCRCASLLPLNFCNSVAHLNARTTPKWGNKSRGKGNWGPRAWVKFNRYGLCADVEMIVPVVVVFSPAKMNEIVLFPTFCNWTSACWNHQASWELLIIIAFDYSELCNQVTQLRQKQKKLNIESVKKTAGSVNGGQHMWKTWL